MSEIEVIQFNQGGFTLFSGVMTVGQLIDHAVPTEWDPGLGWDPDTLNEQGYQRAPIQKHFERIGEFLARERDPLLPTSALLASRNGSYGELNFTPVAGNLGWLKIPETRDLFIVDYQHRWRGFRFAIEVMGMDELRNVRIPFTILADTPVSEEMKQFYLINNNQRRVDTDLSLTLMHAMAPGLPERDLLNLVGPGNRYKIRGTRLVIRFLQSNQGPWAGKIHEPNMPAEPGQLASMKSFVDSLRPVVSTRSVIHPYGDDEIFELISNVWDGILDLHPEWRESSNQFAVQASVGLFVFHRLAAAFLIPEMLRDGDWSPEFVTFMLSETGSTRLSAEFWRAGGGIGAFSSGAGHNELARLIVDDLNQAYYGASSG